MSRGSSTFWSGQGGPMVWHFRMWSPVWISPHKQALDILIPHFTMFAPNLPNPDLSWLSCTHAFLGRVHPGGLVVHWMMYGASYSGTKQWALLFRCKVFNKPLEGPSRWETGRCILDMKDFMKMVNAPSPLVGFYADLVPAFLWGWNSREEWKLWHWSTAKASWNKPHCLIQRNINFVGMGTLCPG